MSTALPDTTEPTGRSLDEWLEVLDAAGAREWSHRQIVVHLAEHHPEVSDWWQQTIAVGYERARGKRVVGQTTKGFQAGVQRTFPGSAQEAWQHIQSHPELWREQVSDIRREKPPERFRFTWRGASGLLTLATTRSGKTAVHVHIENLPDAAAREHAREHWTAVLEALTRD